MTELCRFLGIAALRFEGRKSAWPPFAAGQYQFAAQPFSATAHRAFWRESDRGQCRPAEAHGLRRARGRAEASSSGVWIRGTSREEHILLVLTSGWSRRPSVLFFPPARRASPT